MQNIYQRAAAVLISLGPDFDRLGAPVNDLLVKIGRSGLLSQPLSLPLLPPENRKCFLSNKELVNMGLPTFDEGSWSALKDMLLLLPYFERACVVQEVLTAQNGL